jgi:hypothetical protein
VSGQITRLRDDCGGNTAIEFAFVLPVLLLFIIGIMECGRVLWTQNALNYAVEEAARCAGVNSSLCGSTSQIQAFAASRSGAAFDASVFLVSNPSCGNQVSASYPLTMSIAWLRFSLTLTAQSCAPT